MKEGISTLSPSLENFAPVFSFDVASSAPVLGDAATTVDRFVSYETGILRVSDGSDVPTNTPTITVTPEPTESAPEVEENPTDIIADILPTKSSSSGGGGKAAPILNDLVHVLTTVNEDVANGANTGTLVSNILQAGSLTLVGAGIDGIAITGIDTANGTWEYQLPAGAWINITVTGDTDALLLSDDALIRFVPNADYNGTADITFRAWDQTDGSNSGDTKDISAELGNNNDAFSIDTDTAEITVSAVNDVPTLVTAISDSPAEIGNPFNLDITGNFNDVDVGDVLTYTALLSDSSALPAWLSLDLNTGIFSGTPAGGDEGQLEIEVTADDGNGGTVTARVYVDPNSYVSTGTVGNDTLAGAGHYHGGDGDDDLTGDAGVNHLYGGSGDDTLDGGAGNDILDGGTGNDSIDGGDGADSIAGGDGDDTLESGNSVFLGADDTLDGGNGNDLIISTANNAGYGVLMIGGAGVDTLTGGTSEDTLNGGIDQDSLTGGSGNDTFILDQNTTGNDDHITDMTTASDIIALSDANFAFASGEGAKNGVALTDDTDIFDIAGFAGGSFGAGAGATFLYDTTDGEVWYDADGDGGGGVAVLIATIDNFAGYTYDANDFEGWV